MDGVLRLYWFSQTIGPDRGLEDVARAMGLAGVAPMELHVRGSWHGDYRQTLARVAGEAGVPAEAIVEVDADVFSPNVIGAGLDAGAAGRLRCQAVIGAAVPLLAEETLAETLCARGILCPPEVVAGAGGIVGS